MEDKSDGEFNIVPFDVESIRCNSNILVLGDEFNRYQFLADLYHHWNKADVEFFAISNLESRQHCFFSKQLQIEGNHFCPHFDEEFMKNLKPTDPWVLQTRLQHLFLDGFFRKQHCVKRAFENDSSQWADFGAGVTLIARPDDLLTIPREVMVHFNVVCLFEATVPVQLINRFSQIGHPMLSSKEFWRLYKQLTCDGGALVSLRGLSELFYYQDSECLSFYKYRHVQGFPSEICAISSLNTWMFRNHISFIRKVLFLS